MPSPHTITTEKLARLIGLPTAPAIIDVRIDEDVALDPRIVPAAIRRDHRQVEAWSATLGTRGAVVVCQKGKKLSEGVAAWLRHLGHQADVLAGGHEAWQAAGLPLVPLATIPSRDIRGRTVWVTRMRPKIDRIACPWLIRRFVDPSAVFLFVQPSEVTAVAERFDATPFDCEGVFWSHREQFCTFDRMVQEFGLGGEAIDRLATIVRAADTGQLDLVPQAAGLLAISLGLSRAYPTDLEQLEAGMPIYDALYRWCRDAVTETHDWVSSHGGKAS